MKATFTVAWQGKDPKISGQAWAWTQPGPFAISSSEKHDPHCFVKGFFAINLEMIVVPASLGKIGDAFGQTGNFLNINNTQVLILNKCSMLIKTKQYL